MFYPTCGILGLLQVVLIRKDLSHAGTGGSWSHLEGVDLSLNCLAPLSWWTLCLAFLLGCPLHLCGASASLAKLHSSLPVLSAHYSYILTGKGLPGYFCTYDIDFLGSSMSLVSLREHKLPKQGH